MDSFLALLRLLRKEDNSKKSTKAIVLRPDQHSPMLEAVVVIYWLLTMIP